MEETKREKEKEKERERTMGAGGVNKRGEGRRVNRERGMRVGEKGKGGKGEGKKGEQPEVNNSSRGEHCAPPREDLTPIHPSNNPLPPLYIFIF